MFYFIYAWAVPFIIVITGVILDNSVDETIIEEKEQCWFESKILIPIPVELEIIYQYLDFNAL